MSNILNISNTLDTLNSPPIYKTYYDDYVKATYGIDNEMIDVTKLVHEKLIKHNNLIIPSNCNFNEYFADHVPGKIKFLILEINNKKHILREGKIVNEITYPIDIYYKKITIVYYAYINISNNWEIIISDQLIHLNKCGLLDVAEIYVHVTGEEEYHEYAKQLIRTIIPNVTIYTSIINQYEYPGIHLVWQLAHEKPNNLFLYFHSKGMSYYTMDRRHDEKQIFQEVILPWKKVLDIFNTFNQTDNRVQLINKAGVGSSDKGFMWFNFWWARGSYLIECEEPIINDDRWYYEEWISKKLPNTPISTVNECYSLTDNVFNKIYDATDICNKIDSVILQNNAEF